MIARGLFSFCPPRSHVSSCFPSKSFVSPACKFSSRNSFVSPTYAKTGGCTPSKMSARRHFLSLLPIHALPLVTPLPAAASAEKGFQSLAHSFISWITAIPRPSHRLRTLPQKKGVHPMVPPLSQPFSEVAFSRMAAPPTFLRFTGRWPRSVTPFPASLTQKQRGRGYWPVLSKVERSYQSPSLSAVNHPHPVRSSLLIFGQSSAPCSPLVTRHSPLPFPPPCPSSPFPLKWGDPFPVITGENQ